MSQVERDVGWTEFKAEKTAYGVALYARAVYDKGTRFHEVRVYCHPKPESPDNPCTLPIFTLEMKSAQMLFDELWKAGLRPS